MLYIVYLITLIFPNPNINAKECLREIYVEEHSQEFVMSMPFPKILSLVKNTRLSIGCDMYSKIKKGDTLLAEDVKEFSHALPKKSGDILPHGKITKIKYIVIEK